MKFDNLVVVCLTAIALSFIGVVFVSTQRSNEMDKQKYDLCVSHGGSYLESGSDGFCIAKDGISK